MATIAAISDRGELAHEARREDTALDDAREELMAHAKLLQRAALELDESFLEALSLIVRCRGRVVVSGIGKSGLVARKIASTLACTGTPAFFLHPGEAAHGDLGAMTRDDVVLFVSYSGETREVVWLLDHLPGSEVPVVALTGAPRSTLGLRADVVLGVTADEPTGGSKAVPTGSVLVSQAVGDALALAAMRARGLSPQDIAPLHPGSPSVAPASANAKRR